MKYTSILLMLFFLIAAHSLYTSSYWQKKGINVRDQILEEDMPSAIYLQTSCTDVDLSSAPYNHSGVVMGGYLNVNKAGSGLAFIFYGKEGVTRANVKNYPTIIWLNGGPGASSQMGNFMQLGPHFVRPSNMAPYEIVKNNYTWIKEYNVIFVDQPVGTGLSYADPSHPSPYCKNMADVANDFYYALKELYLNPNGCFYKLGITGSHPLFVFGESYAGKYAPAIGQKIKQQEKENRGFLTGLKGIAFGDGFTHPYQILTQIGEYAFNLGLIDYQERSTIEHIILNATYQQRFRLWTDLHKSFDITLDLIYNMSGGVNVFDITKYQDYPQHTIGYFLHDPNINKKFGLNPDVSFAKQSDDVYYSLYDDFMQPYVSSIQQLLEEKVNVLVYNGQNDLITPTPGTYKWVQMLNYADADKFRDTLLQPWKVKGNVAGFYKRVGNLELRSVNNAGHLVPMDQGENALEMVKSFVQRSL